MRIAILLLVAVSLCVVNKLPAACEPMAEGRVLVTVDASGITDKRADGSDLDLSALAYEVAAKLRAAGIDALTEYDVGELEATPATSQMTIVLAGHALAGTYEGFVAAYTGAEVTGTIAWQADGAPVVSIPFEARLEPSFSVAEGTFTAPFEAPFAEAVVQEASFLKALLDVAERRVGRQRAYHAVIEMRSDLFYHDPTRTWEAFRQIHPDPVGWLKSQLDVPCHATRHRAAEMLSAMQTVANSELPLTTPELIELDFYRRGHAEFLPPDERLQLKDALLVALETSEEEDLRAAAARTLGELDAREAILPLRALEARLQDRIGSDLQVAVSEALFRLDPPAWARPATYFLLLIAVIPVVLLVVLIRRR